MNINYIEITNFRQFKEKMRIDFSCFDSNKITIVFGESATGKTTLIEAFKWILYGKSDYNNEYNHDVASKIGENGKTAIVGEIGFDYNNNSYSVKREKHFVKRNNKLKQDSSFDNYIFEIRITNRNGINKMYAKDDAKRIIEKVMHPSLFEYFFLEGEKLNKYGQDMSQGKNGQTSPFSRAVKGLLGIESINTSIKDLNVVRDKFMSDFVTMSNDEKTVAYQNSKRAFKAQNEKKLEIMNKAKKEEEAYKGLVKEKEAEIEQNASAEEKQKRLNDVNERISKLKILINNERDEIFQRFRNDGYKYLMKKLVKQSRDTFDDENMMYKGIPGIDADAIDFIFEHKRCICGAEIKENSDEWNTLIALRKNIPPESISSEITKYKERLSSKEREGELFYKSYISKITQYENHINDLNKEKVKKENLDDELRNTKEVSNIKKRRDEYQKSADKNKQQVNRLYFEIENNKREIEKYDRLIQSFEASNKEARKYKKYSDYCSYLIDKITSLRTVKEEEIKKTLSSEINNMFKKFYDESVNFTLDESYNIHIVDKNNNEIKTFASGGQNVAIALAFISAIVKVNAEKVSENDLLNEKLNSELYPLVMDAPTSNFDPTGLKNFCDNIPDVTNQIILFVNNKDGKLLKDSLTGIIGKEYTIQKKGTYESVIKEENYE